MNRRDIKEEAKSFAWSNLWNIWKMTLIVLAVSWIFSFIMKAVPGLQTCTTDTITVCTYSTAGTIVYYIGLLIDVCVSFAALAYWLELYRTKQALSISYGFKALKKSWVAVVLASILYGLNIAIGSVLLIVPGVMAALGLTFYNLVIIDNPELNCIDALKKTWNLTKGYKGDLFVFFLSFIGWTLLCIFVIPAIWALPYITIAEIVYYENLKTKNVA